MERLHYKNERDSKTLNVRVGICTVMATVVKNGYGDSSYILDETVYLSHSASTLGKGTNSTILLQLWVNNWAAWAL